MKLTKLKQSRRSSRSGGLRDVTSRKVSAETALLCCFRVAVEYGAFFNIDAVQERNMAGLTETSVGDLVRLGSDFKLSLTPARLGWSDLLTTRFTGPVLLILKNGNVVVLRGMRAGERPQAMVYDPLFAAKIDLPLSREQLEAAWDGPAILTNPAPAATGEERHFGFSWFAGRLFREHRVMRDIFISAMSMNLVTLAVPLFFQIIIDKVLTSRATSTLTVLSFGVCVLLLFDSVFNYLRNLLLAHLTRKFDQTVSDETVGHLLTLPVDYFNRNSRGVIVYKLNEANNVRDFLASRLFNTFLDMTGVLVVLPVLTFYSLELTGLTLIISAITFVIIAIVSRRFRRQLEVVNAIEARRKGVLVEFIQGITTIKTLAIETHCLRLWRRLSGDAATSSLRLSETAASARAVLSGLEKSITVVIAIFGVTLVLNGKLSLGALVAFNMLVTRVSGPLINSASLLQDYQKAVLSLRMLGDLMQTKPEARTGQLMTPIKGRIEFIDVTFSYPGQITPALNKFSLTIEPGQRVGMVGRSGSGKTTVTRLLQGLYQPQSGTIRIDGTDIKEMDVDYLRSRIGVVMQENFFFRGSVRENLGLTRPDASLEEIIRAARHAGADEFIQQLAQGYMTLLEENAQNLSGGQRQRLAIARAILGKPPLLVFDEATSALDPESEEIVRSSMRTICHGRTTLIVTHRLSFIRDADLIVVLDRGGITATGAHNALLRQSLVYRKFWNQQSQVLA